MSKLALVIAFAALAILASGVALAVAGALPSLDAPDRPSVPVSPQQVAEPTPKPTPTPYVKQGESPVIVLSGVPGGVLEEKNTGKEETAVESKPDRTNRVQVKSTPPSVVLRGAPSQGKDGRDETDSEGGQGTVYTWQDGDREMRSVLQDDASDPEENTPTRDDRGITVKGVQGSGKGSGEENDNVLPEFRMESGGGLMTLPGGVILILDPDWDEARVDRFFSRNGISAKDVKELEFLDNGFLIETEPGFPSLNLANDLAGKKGVISSSPNWARERQAK